MEECFLEVEVAIECRSNRPCCRTLTKAELSLLAQTRDKTAMVKHLIMAETKNNQGNECSRRGESESTVPRELFARVRKRAAKEELLNDDEIGGLFRGFVGLWLTPCASTTLLDDDDVGLFGCTTTTDRHTPPKRELSFLTSRSRGCLCADPRLNLRVAHVESFVEFIDTSRGISFSSSTSSRGCS